MTVAAIWPNPEEAANTGATVGMKPTTEPGLNRATLQSCVESFSVHIKLSATSKVSDG